jgi:uncharacterized membrane protein
MASQATRLKAEIDRWLKAGLLDGETAARLRADVDARPQAGFSFAGMLAGFAALLFGAATLLFVAANWEAIPRTTRVAMTFTLIAAAYLGGAGLALRGRRRFAEAAWLVGVAAFGGGIALVGQMYHLSGDEADALLIWCLAAGLAAALLRSASATAASVAIATAWMWVEGWGFWDNDVPLSFLAILAALWALSWWTRSIAARHFALLALSAFTLLAYLGDASLLAPMLLAIGAAALFVLAVRRPDVADRYVGIGGIPVHAMLSYGFAMVLLHFSLGEGVELLVIAVIALASSIGALVLTGGRDRAVRWLAYLGFGIELFLVYMLTLGTMLGTAGFLLAAGLLLAISAVVILRFERRMKAPAQPTETIP